MSLSIQDDDVRKSWQLEPSQITICHPDWNKLIKLLINREIVEQLGLSHNNVGFTLYKLLLYEKGGHFKAHRDTEKENRKAALSS